MTAQRIFQLALGLTIAAFMTGCGGSTSDHVQQDAAARDSADAWISPDAPPSDPRPTSELASGSGDVTGADAGRVDGTDAVAQIPDAPPAGLDAPPADAPTDTARIDSPVDRAKVTEAGGDIAPPCTEGATESCVSPDNPLIGSCHAGTRTCVRGEWGTCSETMPAPRESCTGADDNCNGLIDEGCEAGCIVVCGNCADGSDGGTANGSVEHPYTSIEAALAAAGQNDAGAGKRICVVGGPTCRELTLYPTTGPLKIPDGIIIQGSYALTETGLTYCGLAGVRPRTTLSFASSEGVVFDQSVVAGAELSSMNIEINPPSGPAPEADTATAIAIKGGKNVTLSRVYVAAGFSAPHTRGVSVAAGGQVTITGSSINTGQGRASAVGLYVSDGTVNLRHNCDKLVNGRCESNCFDGGAMQGIHGYSPSTPTDAPAQSSGVYVLGGSVSIVGNMLCGGGTNIVDGQAPASLATLRCENAGCASVIGNVIVGGTDRDALAVALVGASPLLNGNHIYGGCGSRTTTGLRLEDSAARLQNNQIMAGVCESSGVSVFRGVHLIASGSAANPDIHSNTIEPLGLASDCQSTGVQVELAAGATSATSGVLRNNIISAGECKTRMAISEAIGATLKSLLNNDLYGPAIAGTSADIVLYGHNGTQATSSAQVNAIPLAAGNISSAPGYSAYPSDLHLTDGSPCVDMGTGTGAPIEDGDGNPRPAGEGFDMGAYELSM